MRNRYIHIILFVLTWIYPFDAYAGETPLFEPIPEEQYPALVFIQEDPTLDYWDRTSLIVANFIDGKPNIQKVMTAQSVQALQLADAVFLLEAYYYPPGNYAE